MRDLDFALRLADAADPIAMRRYRAHDLAVRTKPDLTPVSEADDAVEAELRRLVAEERPGEAVLGEELGGGEGAATRWIVDPIDGTRNYTRGIPVWATLIALERDGALELGVVSAPALGRRWWATRGGGAFANGEPIRVSRIERIEDATVAVPADAVVPALVDRAWHVRGFGDFWAHMLVAEGSMDVAVDQVGLGIWDVAAVQVIVEEAGGRLTDRAGVARPDGGSSVSSNGLLHEEALAALGPTS